MLLRVSTFVFSLVLITGCSSSKPEPMPSPWLAGCPLESAEWIRVSDSYEPATVTGLSQQLVKAARSDSTVLSNSITTQPDSAFASELLDRINITADQEVLVSEAFWQEYTDQRQGLCALYSTLNQPNGYARNEQLSIASRQFGVVAQGFSKVAELERLVQEAVQAQDPVVQPSNRDFELLRLYYATDRKALSYEEATSGSSLWSNTNTYLSRSYENGIQQGVYGTERSDLKVGSLVVSVPANHRTGEISRPGMLDRENAKEHIVLQNVNPLSESYFYPLVKKESEEGDQLMLFIHGFNVDFEEAAWRAAQISHDLQFVGARLMYSWPSNGSYLPQHYHRDKTDAEWSGAIHLARYLEKIVHEVNPEKIHIIAHSMGNLVLSEALEEMTIPEDRLPLFENIILAAPDLDADLFQRTIAPRMKRVANRVTMYVSAEDKALALSKDLNAAPRAGDANENLVLVDGIETIDLTNVGTDMLGHSTFANESPLIDDLFSLIRHNLSAAKRRLSYIPMAIGGYYLVPSQN